MKDTFSVSNLLERADYEKRILPFTGKPLIKVICGIRRCGKSSLMALVARRIQDTADSSGILLHLNMESLDNASFKNIRVLHDHIKNLVSPSGAAVSLFIDEIQEIPGWEKVINSLLADGLADIYISGSNSRLLSGELATLLSGRYVEQQVFPLTFSEFLAFRAKKDDEGNTDEEFSLFLQYGGFPGIHHLELTTQTVYQYLDSLTDSVLLKDVILRHGIRDAALLKSLLMFLADNCGSLFSARSVADYLKKERRALGIETIYNYLSYLEEAFIIYKVPRFDLRGKRQLETLEKYYLADISLRHALLGYRERDISIFLENIVFIELKKRGYSVSIGKQDDLEIDFIASRGNSRIYIQVAYLLADDQVREREFRPLLKIKDNYPKYVLTMDKLPPGNDWGIHRLYLPDWLLEIQ